MSATKQAIMEAAIRVFNDDYSAPLEQVAAQAGVTRRTLHRYFAGREELLACCVLDMQRVCRQALAQALDSSEEPLTQLERLLYAVVDCGAKYAFLHKLPRQLPARPMPAEGDEDYQPLHGRFRDLVQLLQARGTISAHLTAEWVKLLLDGIVAATIQATALGAATPAQVKQFAWFSFSRGIGR